MSMMLFGGLSGRSRSPSGGIAADAPLVVAIHGGTYNSAYFDLPGHSLLDRAAAIGIPSLAPDRPGYGAHPPLEDGTIAGQARFLTVALGDAWARHGAGTRGIVLIGHSIGAAIALTIAGEPSALPLIGVAVSGVGLRTPPEHATQWARLPDTSLVDLPAALKDILMFGPTTSYPPSMPAASHAASAPAPRAELIDVVATWHERVRERLGRVTVPVHYRQGEFDHLWIVDQGEVDGFRDALGKAPRVDAALMPGTGHCMDLHRIGGALQTQQLGFALQCAGGSAGGSLA